MGDQACYVAAFEARVNIDYGDPRSATAHHTQERSDALKIRSIANTGRYRNDRAGDQSTDHACQRALHTSHDYQGSTLAQASKVSKQTIRTGDTDIAN